MESSISAALSRLVQLFRGIRSKSVGAVASGPGTEAILVTIDSVGQITIDGQLVASGAVRPRIEKLHRAHPKRPLIIDIDESPPTKVIVSVIEAAHLSGISSVGRISVSDEE